MNATAKQAPLIRGTIDLALGQGRVAVKAQLLSGLALHRGYTGEGRTEGAFCVSHVSSGLQLAMFSLHRDAKQFLHRALELGVDWTADKDSINTQVFDDPTISKNLRLLARLPCATLG